MRARLKSSYHWRWVSRAFVGVWPIAGGWRPLVFSVVAGFLFAVLSPHPATPDAVSALVDWTVPFLQAMGLALAFVFVAQLITTPRNMAMQARTDARAIEEQLRAQIPVADAALAATVLSCRPYVESRRIVKTNSAGSVCGVEYRNEAASVLEGCTVVWELLESPVASFGWTKVDWFARHRLDWDDTGQHDARIAAGQSRRVELVICWPGGAAASVWLPGDSPDGWFLPEGEYLASLSVVANGHRERKEQYQMHWADGSLSIDQSGDLLT